MIVTAYNRADLVEDTLASLAEQEWDGDWEVLLVDNDSSDATPEILERRADEMPVPARVLTATEGHSCTHNRNAGAAATDSASFAFVDDDVLAAGWVAAMGKALRDHDYVASRCEYFELNDPEIAALHTFRSRRLGKHLGTDIVDGAGSGQRRDLWQRHGGCAGPSPSSTPCTPTRRWSTAAPPTASGRPRRRPTNSSPSTSRPAR